MTKPARDWQHADFEALAAEGLSVSVEATTRAAASTDFGGIARGESLGVVSVRNADEVQKAVQVARARGLSLTMRGTGRSAGGQSVPRKGVTLDVSRLDELSAPDAQARSIVCGPGARWRSVVGATLQRGLLPQVLPLNLDLTVGGTLSVGGFGSNSHVFGFCAGGVAALQAVSGAGDALASEGEPELLAATLGGRGRCAVITSVTLALRTVPAKVRTFYLLYDDLAAWLGDLRDFRERFDHMDGFCSASVQGMRSTAGRRRPFAKWFYGLHVSVEYDQVAPDAATALRGMHQRWTVHEEDNDVAAFVARADPRFEMMSKLGAFAQPHPWLECLLPVSSLEEVLPRVLDALPLVLGDGHRLALLAATPNAPLLVTPKEEAVMFAVLPSAVPAALLPDVLPALRAVNALLLAAGGKRYLAGWLELDEAGWRAHYGECYERWAAAKRRLDPDDVFDSVCG